MSRLTTDQALNNFNLGRQRVERLKEGIVSAIDLGAPEDGPLIAGARHYIDTMVRDNIGYLRLAARAYEREQS